MAYFEPKWDLVPKEKRDEIIAFAKENTANVAGKKYASECGMSVAGLANKLRAILNTGIKKINYSEEKVDRRRKENKPRDFEGEAKSKAQSRKKAFESVRLTPKEKKLIKEISEGKVDLETASRVVAAKAFEKMLKFPDSVSFNNFLQSELLKLKRQEIENKNNWAYELINRMFAGQLPPQECPKCGHVLYNHPVEITNHQEGGIVDVEPLSLTGNN